MHSASIVVLLALVALAHGHMMMSDPAPWRSKFSPGPNNDIDFSYTSPLGTFPCKGYAPQASVKTVKAGSSLPVTIQGGAPHGGGHCQFALSYDNQKTWVVLDTIIRDCMRTGAGPFTFNVPIPASVPGGNAAFAFAWINAQGNREYYMNCATVTVQGDAGAALTGPELLVANLPGFVTIPEFGGNNPDRRELFDQRKIITVRGNGSVAPGGPAPPAAPKPKPPTPAPAPAPPAPAPPANPAPQPKPQPPAKPAPVPAPAPAPVTPPPTTRPPGGRDQKEECTDGQFRCTENATKIGQCMFGKWIDTPVAPGTACKLGPNNLAFLGFPE
ncbi:hypothetical protein H9P43_000692 [Blastocladiella emersonii ATCC 22665]|nr:hypothetical protein H9P43_000692 [Blastocladiella emersonii ATCC 22665]